MGGPKRPNKAPDKKMRAMNWKKLPATKAKNSIWSGISDEWKIDFKKGELTDWFNVVDAAEKKPEASKKVVVPSFLDPKRSQNVGIQLASLKSLGTFEEMRALIVAPDGDSSKLNIDMLKILQQVIPGAEDPSEIEALSSHVGDRTLLGKPEQFMFTMMDVPKLAERIDLLLFEQEFAELVADNKPNVELLCGACAEVKSSSTGKTRLKRLLEIILKIGNHMNGGTSRGGLYGFQIQTVNKLNDIKTGDRKTTLLDFVVEYCMEHEQDLVKWPNDMPQLPDAADLTMANSLKDLKELQTALKKATTQCAALAAVEDAAAQVEKLRVFIQQRKQEVDLLESSLKQSMADSKATLATFGMDANRGKVEDLFGCLRDFVKTWTLSIRKIETRKEKEAKKEERRAKAMR